MRAYIYIVSSRRVLCRSPLSPPLTTWLRWQQQKIAVSEEFGIVGFDAVVTAKTRVAIIRCGNDDNVIIICAALVK